MNDAISTIALGVDTKTGKQHLAELTAGFAGLKSEIMALNALRTNPEALTGGAAQANRELTTLSAELRNTKAQVAGLQNELMALSRSQVAAAQSTAAAVKTAASSQATSVIESEKKAAEATQRLAKETTKVMQEEAAKRYSMGQSAKVGGVSYSMKGSSNEAELNLALAASERTRREILANSRSILMADVERGDALRREKAATSNTMLMAEVERFEALRREKLVTSQTMMMAEIDRTEAVRREKAATTQAMIIADTERAEAVRREKIAASQVITMAEADRAEAIRRERNAAGQAMLIADIDKAEQAKLQKLRSAREMEMAEIDRREKQAAEIRAVGIQMRIAEIEREELKVASIRAMGNTMRMAEIDRADSLAREKQRMSTDMMIADIERGEARKQAILNNNFNSGSLRSQASTVGRAKGLVDTGQAQLAKELYGSDAVNSISKLDAMHTALNNTVNKGGTIKQEASKRAKMYGDTLNEVHSAARGLAGGLGQLWLTWGSIVPLVAGAAVTGSMVKVFTAGKEVEYQLQFLRALSDDITREPVNLDGFLKITDGTMASVKEAAGGMRALAQAGLDQKAALVSLPDILNLATIGEMSVGAAALSATGVVNAFGLSVENIGHVGDVFARVAASSNTSVQGMTESMKQASTVGEMFKVSLEETAASIGVLAQRNIIGTSAGTSLTNALKNLYEPTAKARAVMKEFNITTDDGHGGLKGYTQLVTELAATMSTLDDSSKAVVLGTITDQRGAKTLSAITENLGKYNDFLDKARNSTGFMSEATLQLEDTVQGSMHRMANTVDTAFNKAFANSQPTIRGVMTEMTELAKSEKLVDILTTLAVAAARMTGAFIDNAGAIATVVGAYIGLRVVASISNAYVLLRTSMMAATLATEANLIANAANAGALTAEAAAANAAGVAMTRFAVATRIASAAFGPIAALLAIGYTAYELLSVNVDKSENSLRAANNTIDTTLDYYDRQIEKLKQLNEQLKLNGDEATKSTFKTAKAILEAELMKEDSGIDAMRAARPARLTTSTKTSAGNVVNNMPTRQDDSELSAALARRRVISDRIEKLNRDEIAMSDLKGENLALTGKKQVSSRIDSMIESAGGGMFKDRGTEETKKLVPILEEYKRQLNEGEASYLMIAPLVGEIGKKLNEGKRHYTRPDHKGENDTYKAKQTGYDGDLQAIKNREKSGLAGVQSRLNTNEIGDLQAIAENLRIVKQARAEELEVFKKKEDLAASQEKRTRDVAAIENKKSNTRFQDGESEADAGRKTNEIYAKWAQEKLKVEADTLRKRGDLVGAYIAEYGSKFGDDIQRIERDLKVPGIDNKQRSELEGRRDYLLSQRSTGIDSADFEQTKNAYDELMAKMDEKLADVATKASNTNGFLSDVAALEAAEAIRNETLPAAEELLATMTQLAESMGDGKLKTTISKMGTDLAKEAGRVRTEWVNAGKSIEKSLSDAFGNSGKAVGGLIAALVKQKAQQKEINSDLAKGKATDPLKAIELEKRAREESTMLQMSSYGEMAGAAKMFFNEQSKGYEALKTAEQVFRAFELAKAAEAFVTKTFFTTAAAGVAVTSDAIKVASAELSTADIIALAVAEAEAKGVVAVVNQGGGDPYTAWSRMALMAAGVAALGIMVSGGGGSGAPKMDVAKERQKFQGTGITADLSNDGKNNPYGWEVKKSDSISKSLEVMRSNSDVALKYSASQLSTLENINNGISGMAAMVTQSSGLRGTRADELSLGVGSSKSFASFSKSSTELRDMGIAFSNSTVGEAIKNGVSASSYANVHSESSSWWGLSKDSKDTTVTGSLDSAFTSQMTAIIKDMFNSVSKASEFLGMDKSSLEEILGSVSMGGAGMTNISLKGLTTDEIEKELQAIFGNIGDVMAKAAMPGLEDWKKSSESYMGTLVRVASGVDTATFAMEKLGISMVDYASVANKQGDVATEIIRSSLMMREFSGVVYSGIGKVVETFTGSATDLASAYTKLDTIRNTMKSTGVYNPDVSTDMIRGAGGLDQLSSGMSSYLDNFFKTGEKASIQADLLSKEFQKLNLVMPSSKEQFRKIAETMGKDMSPEGQRLYGVLMSLTGKFADIADDAGIVSPALAKQKSAVDDLIKSANKWLDVSKNARSMLRDLDKELNKDGKIDSSARISELRTLMSSGTVGFEQQLELAGEIKDLVLERFQIEKENAETLITFGRDLKTYVQGLRVGELSPLTNKQKLEEANSQYNQTVENLGSSDTGIRDKARSDLQEKSSTLLDLARTYFSSSQGYKDIFERVTTQLDAVGINAVESGTSMESISKVQLDELRELRGLVQKVGDKAYDQYKVSERILGDQLGTLQRMYESLGVISQVPEILLSLPAELAAAMGGLGVGGQGVIKTPSEQIEELYKSVLGRQSDSAGMDFWTDVASRGTSMSAITGAFYQSDEYKKLNGSHALGLDYVPFDGYVAELHRGERVMTASEARRTDKAAMASTGSFSANEKSEMAAQIRELTTAVNNLTASQTVNTMKMVQGMYASTKQAASHVVDGTKDALSSGAFNEKLKPAMR